jgi:SAM-dependent methyltransferase/putative flippase GtrA
LLFTGLVVAMLESWPLLDPVVASVVAFIVILPFAYTAHRYFSFAGHEHADGTLVRFVVITSLSFATAVGAMYLVTTRFHAPYYWGIALNWLLIPVVNYIVYLLWVFRRRASTGVASVRREAAGSPERFGYSWNIYSELRPEYEEQFRRWTEPIPPGEWRGRRFLDAGCGIGRNAFWAMCWGATGGSAIDLDERTLARARETLARLPAVEVKRQSIYDISDRDTFDIVFSIGVVHHLENPELAVAKLVQAAKPGGIVLVWLYGRENNGWIVGFFDPLRRALLSRLPLGVVHSLSWLLTAVLWCSLRAGMSRLEYFRLLRTFEFRHLRAIVFDHMIPRIAHYYSHDEARDLLESAGLRDVTLAWTNRISWAVAGRKP